LRGWGIFQCSPLIKPCHFYFDPPAAGVTYSQSHSVTGSSQRPKPSHHHNILFSI